MRLSWAFFSLDSFRFLTGIPPMDFASTLPQPAGDELTAVRPVDQGIAGPSKHTTPTSRFKSAGKTIKSSGFRTRKERRR
jgi:hypothetical protein